jgi:energy-coupling factor transport system ATP-binding protein
MIEKETNIKFLIGKNFSGRSDYLKQLGKTDSETLDSSIYVGEIPYNYLSGVSPTVLEELELFSQNTGAATLNAIYKLLDQYEFRKLYNSNPFLLSGGEQVVLSIIIGLLLEAPLMSIDTATEQLNLEWSEPLFDLMKSKLPGNQYFISDNRMDEYNFQYDTLIPEIPLQDYKYTFHKPEFKNIKLENSPKEVILQDIKFGYSKKIKVLQNINLELKPGNIYFLKGVNGAGKSTLSKVLSGIFKTQDGQIIVNNNRINPYKYPGKLFGYSFQNPDEQLFSRTVEEEVLRFEKRETKAYSDRRDLFLEMFGLNEIRTCHPAELPFVIRKRIALAATLATDRPWYIMDEPTIGQDSEFIDFLVSLFSHLVNQGKGLIIISHSQKFIQMFNAKVLYLVNGRLNCP